MNNYRKRLLEALKLDINIQKAYGTSIYDEDGNIIIDCIAQYGALPLGHNNELIIQTSEQFLKSRTPNFVQPFSNPSNMALLKKLTALLGKDYENVAFGNSGAEAVEASIKLARLHTGRKKILSLKRSFHGKTFAALSACGSDNYKEDELVDYENYDHVEVFDLDKIKHLFFTLEYAAFIYEPVLGEGGMEVHDLESLKAIEKLAYQTKTVLIADEIQCGLGRCGEISYALSNGLNPHIILFSKALSGGLVPISCLIYKNKVYSSRFEKIHSSTFASGGLASHCALTTLDLISGSEIVTNVDYLDSVFEKRKLSFEKKYKDICSITGTKLLRGFHFFDKESIGHLVMTYLYNSGSISFVITSYLLKEKGILTMPSLSAKKCLRFQPALNAKEEVVNTFFDAVEEVSELIKNGRYDILLAPIIDKEVEALKQIDKVYSLLEHPRNIIAMPNIKAKNNRTFAFLIHPPSVEEMVKGLPISVLKNYSSGEIKRLVDTLFLMARLDINPEVCHSFSVSNKSMTVNGNFILAPILPEHMVKLPSKEKKALLKDYVQVAKKAGADVIGLGAFTSVISKAGVTIQDEVKDLTLTTGNSLTATSTIFAIKEYFEKKSKNKIAVVGALGSVGQIISIGVSCFFSSVILLGKKNTAKHRYLRLLEKMIDIGFDESIQCSDNSVIAWIRKLIENNSHLSAALIAKMILSLTDEDNCPINIHEDIDVEKLNKACCIVSATSAGKSFIDPSTLSKEILLVDVARPSDFKGSYQNLVEGGIVKQPEAVRYGDCNMVHTDTGYNLACLSETISLALSNANGHYSIGLDVSYKDALAIHYDALKNGFVPRPFIINN